MKQIVYKKKNAAEEEPAAEGERGRWTERREAYQAAASLSFVCSRFLVGRRGERAFANFAFL